jgi:hypothetical protein
LKETSLTESGKANVPDWETLNSERKELAKSKSLPNVNDQLADIRWFECHRNDPQIQDHRGDYVAILNGQVVGAGGDPLKLEVDCAKRFDIHPARLLVEWVDDGRDLHVVLSDNPIDGPKRGTDVQDSP